MRQEASYFNGYFSNEPLSDIDENNILTCIDKDDLTKVSRQLSISMGEMFALIKYFALILAVLIIYLLVKLIIEKNASAISLVKVLGYSNGEIFSLYLVSTTWVVVISIVLSLFLTTIVMDKLFYAFMQGYGGWFDLYIAPSVYGKMFIMNLFAFSIVAIIQYWKIKKIPLEEAMKNVE